jgi:hypothetical protein
VRHRLPNEVGQQIELRKLALGRITRLELVVVLFVHGASLRLQ